jgi:molecular chaperone HscC
VFVVVDLGGGTFDVCVMELFEGVLQVKGVAGESRLGGEDFTLALAEHIARRADLTMPAAGTTAWALLYKRAETAKRALSRWTAHEVALPADVAGRPGVTVALTADEVEALWAPLLERLRGPIRAALRGAGVTREQLHEVVLVGGATRMPCVQRVIAEVLGRQPVHHADPDLLVTDVASHSLGVDTTREIAGRPVHGYFSPVIHRNTVIPTSRWESYATLADNQTHVNFGIYEGESRLVAENRRIGELHVPVPIGPAPKEVRVRFTYDPNGMLEVEALVVETGRTASKVFERTGGELTGAALAEAQARLRALRADPLERPRYKDLHARAKLLWQEADPRGREELGFLIDQFDAAIEGRNPAVIEKAYGVLAARCEAIDGGERW